MLVYARKERADIQRVNDSSSLIPNPPRHAMEIVNKLNAEHDETCEKFAAREKLALTALNKTRDSVLDICRSWNPDPENDRVSLSKTSMSN